MTSHRRQLGLGARGDGSGHPPYVSANGRYVAFTTWAAHVVAGDTNRYPDVFVRDRQSGRTYRVSVTNRGRQANAESDALGISATGRYVLFASFASNLNPHDTGPNVFVRDTLRHRTMLASVTRRGVPFYSVEDATISGNGRYVAFSATRGGAKTNVYVRDLWRHRTSRLTVTRSGRPANGNSYMAHVVAGGRLVFFTTWSTNLTRNHRRGIIAHNMVTGVNHWVARLPGDSNASPFDVSADGQLVVYPHRQCGRCRTVILLRNRKRHTTRLMSRHNSGTPFTHAEDPHLSPDGRYVTFTQYRSYPRTGAYVPEQVYLRDRRRAHTTLISVGRNGQPGSAGSWGGDISDNDRFITFYSDADNLVRHDTNDNPDAFIRRFR